MVKMSARLLDMTRAKDWNYLVVSAGSEDENAIKKINPFRVNRFFKNLCKGNSLRDVRSINSGKSLLIIVECQEVAQLLLAQTKIPGNDGKDVPIKVTVSDRIGTKQGVFFCDQIVSMRDEEIVTEINLDNPDVKVVGVRRLKKKDNNGGWIESGSFVLTMRCEKIPEKLKIGYLMKNMRPFIPDPMRCFRCNKLGHMSTRCREKNENEKNCINCNEPQHTDVGEKCTKPPKCANCLSIDHNSAFRNCPKYLEDKKINEVMATYGHNRREAALLVKGSLSQSEGNVQHNANPQLTLRDRLKAVQDAPSVMQTTTMAQLKASLADNDKDIEMRNAPSSTENRSRSTAKEMLLNRRERSKASSNANSIEMTSSEERKLTTETATTSKKARRAAEKERVNNSQPPGVDSNGSTGQGKGGGKKNKNNGSQ